MSLLFGGIGTELLALVWLIVFSATGGAAPVAVAPGDPPKGGLVLAAVGLAAIVPGLVMAVIYRTREERGVAAGTAGGSADAGARVAEAIRTAYASRFSPYRRRLAATTIIGLPLALAGPMISFAMGGFGIAVGVVVAVVGFAIWVWGWVGLASMGRIVQRDLVAAGLDVRRPAPMQNAWSLQAWAERNQLTPELIVQAAAHSAA